MADSHGTPQKFLWGPRPFHLSPKWAPFFKLIAAGEWSNFGLKSGPRDDSENDAENGEYPAAIRVRKSGLVMRRRIVRDSLRNFRASGAMSLSPKWILFEVVAAAFGRIWGKNQDAQRAATKTPAMGNR